MQQIDGGMLMLMIQGILIIYGSLFIVLNQEPISSTARGALTRYAVSAGCNTWRGGEKIISMEKKIHILAG